MAIHIAQMAEDLTICLVRIPAPEADEFCLIAARGQKTDYRVPDFERASGLVRADCESLGQSDCLGDMLRMWPLVFGRLDCFALSKGCRTVPLPRVGSVLPVCSPELRQAHPELKC